MRSILRFVSAATPALIVALTFSVANGFSCPSLTRTMKRDSRSSEVYALQSFLALDKSIYPEGLATGYFGPATERAVQRFQAKGALVDYGTPGSTGWGIVGPKTRDLIEKVCIRVLTHGNTSLTPNGTGFEGYPTSGEAPLAVHFAAVFADNKPGSYTVDFGDTNTITINSWLQIVCAHDDCKKYYGLQLTHIYAAGDYTATLASNDSFLPKKMSTVSITVTPSTHPQQGGMSNTSQTGTTVVDSMQNPDLGLGSLNLSGFLPGGSNSSNGTATGTYTSQFNQMNSQYTSASEVGSCKTWVGSRYPNGTIQPITLVTHDYQEIVSTPT